MSSNSIVKRPTVSDSNGDRISALPDDVIDNILKHLPLHEVVRTSILSRAWRYKWNTLPYLDFENGIFRNAVLRNWDSEFLLDYILPWHEGPLVKFRFISPSAACDAAMGRWMHSLLEHPIEELALSWHLFSGPDSGRPLLPSNLFGFENLKSLYLSNVDITLPPEFEGFSKLVNLEFIRVRIELDELQMMISRCPVLECLKLLACINTQLWFLDIESPSLKCFHFQGRFSAISFRNAAVEEIKIALLDVYDNFELRGNKSELVEVCNVLPSIKKMSLNGVFLQFLALGGELQILPGSLNHLIFLDIDDFDSGVTDQISSALWLIKISPNLQRLEVSFDLYEEDASTEYLKAQQQTCNVPLSHLKYVRIFGVSGLESQLEFVKLILLWATALEKLEIMTFFRSETDDESDVDRNDQSDYDTLLRKYEILKEIASYPRASSKVAFLLDKF